MLAVACKLHIRLTVACFLFRIHILAPLLVLIGEAWIMDASLLTTLLNSKHRRHRLDWVYINVLLRHKDWEGKRPQAAYFSGIAYLNLLLTWVSLKSLKTVWTRIKTRESQVESSL
jgi:hypothetical protein